MLSIINNWRSPSKSCGNPTVKKQTNKNVDSHTLCENLCDSWPLDFNFNCFTVNIFGLFLFVLCSFLCVTMSSNSPFPAGSGCDLHSIIRSTIDNLIIYSDRKLRVSWLLCCLKISLHCMQWYNSALKQVAEGNLYQHRHRDNLPCSLCTCWSQRSFVP